MRKYKIIFIFFFICVSVYSNNFVLPILKSEIKIDGNVSKEEYKEALKITNFIMFEPVEGKEPQFNTLAFLGCDNLNLYIAFICYDDIFTLKATLTKRDIFSSDDMVFIELDPIGNLENFYIFGANPLGVKYDGIRYINGEEDYKFDTNFDVKSEVYDSFWVAEFKIPFSSFSTFSPRKRWRFFLTRIRPRENFEIYSFPPISKSIPSICSQSGSLILPFQINIRILHILPYILLFRNSDSNPANFLLPQYKLGLTGKYKHSPQLTFDFAINPDYAQIETDMPQIDVNTTFALFYPEKRPIFMEGLSLFQTPIKVIYTRNMNAPLYALKLTGRFKRYDIGLISTYDKHSVYVIPFEEASFSLFSNKKSFSNIFRIKKDLFEESYIGLLLAHREIENSFNRIGGVDTRLRFLNHYILDYQFVYSYTKEPFDSILSINFNNLNFKKFTGRFDGEKFRGFAQETNFNLYFRNFIGNIWFRDYSPTFRSDLGFIERNNFKEIEIKGGPRCFPNKYGLSEITLWLWFSQMYNYENILREKQKTASLYMSFIGQTTVITKFSNIYKKYGEKRFPDLWDYNISIYTSPIKYFSLNNYFNISKTINYTDTTKGYSIYYSLFFELKPIPKIQTSVSLSRYYLYKRVWKNSIYDVKTMSAKFSYQFTLNLSFRSILQYYTKTKELGIYSLISYELNPFTVLYLGANINALKYTQKLEGKDHQVFLKFQYLFKI